MGVLVYLAGSSRKELKIHMVERMLMLLNISRDFDQDPRNHKTEEQKCLLCFHEGCFARLLMAGLC